MIWTNKISIFPINYNKEAPRKRCFFVFNIGDQYLKSEELSYAIIKNI